MPEKYLYRTIFSCLVITGFASCSTLKNTRYFDTISRDTVINTPVNRLTESTIRKNDQLAIIISSLNPAEDAMFNATAVSGYLVDINGNIQIHRLGTIAAAGMTRRELKEKIENDIKPWLKDPLVTVRYMNHKVTVLAETGGSQVIPMPEEQLSILEVMGTSGITASTSKIKDILVIRETETGKQFKRLNLEDHSIFTSNWYYLQPGDVVYVEPGDKKIKDEKRARFQQNLALSITAVSFAILILDRILR